MAASMMRITVKDLKDLIKDKDDKEVLGYMFSTKENVHQPEHQVIVLHEPLQPI